MIGHSQLAQSQCKEPLVAVTCWSDGVMSYIWYHHFALFIRMDDVCIERQELCRDHVIQHQQAAPEWLLLGES